MSLHARWIPTLFISWLLLCAFLLRWEVAPSNGYMGIEADLIEYKQAMHRALTLGLHEVYTPNKQNDPAITGKEWEGGYFITNPPARIYSYYPFVSVYRYFSPEGFSLWSSELNFFHDIRDQGLRKRIDQSRGFSIALKLPAILADVMISLAIFLLLKNYLPWRVALVASAIYAFTPGIIIDSAHTGSHDAVAILLLVMALWSVGRGWIEVAAALFVLAALSKPQVAAFLFFMLFLGFRYFSLRRVIQATALAIATAGLVFLPFIAHGTFNDTLSALVHATFGGEPYISLNATNLWWLLSLGRGAEVTDTTMVLGLISFRTLGLLMFLWANIYTMHRLSLVPITVPRIFLGASFIAMAYFTLNTELHENHMIYVLPLLLLALPCYPKILGIVLILAVTLSLNFILLDPGFYAVLHRVAGLDEEGIRIFSVISAGINVAAFMVMMWFLHRETSTRVSWLEIFMAAVFSSVVVASFITLNPAHITREYRISVSNSHIQERSDVLDVMVASHRYENMMADFSKEMNLTSEQLMAGVEIVIDVEKSAGDLTVVIRVSALEKDQERLDRLAPLFVRLQSSLREDLERFERK